MFDMSRALDPWSDIRDRLERLHQQRRAAFALVCAEHLVRSAATATTLDLRGSVDKGWAALINGQLDPEVRQRLVESDDLDEDEVAAVAYALGAVSGQTEDGWWAVSRCMDAAFDRVPYPDGARIFRPLELDAASHEVQQELRWQLIALDMVEEPGELAALVPRLRALT
jgi:hypothetical protein